MDVQISKKINLKLIELNNERNWYFLLIIVNILFILQLKVAVQNFFIQMMINYKLILIPYILFSLIGYYFLFKYNFKKEIHKTYMILLLIFFLFLCTLLLTFLGNYNFIDKGTDNDDALEIFIQYFLHGDYPYNHLTQLHNRITPFPFLPIYSMFFFFLGNVAYQNIVNVVIIISIFWLLSNNNDKKIFSFFCLILSLPLYLFLITQSDHLTVPTMLLLILFLLTRSRYYSSSVLTGCMIASKGYFWIVVPAIIMYLYRKTKIKTFFKCSLTVIIFALLFIIPFLVWDPNTFLHYAPIGVIEDANYIAFIPYSQFILPLLYCFVSFICALKINNIFLVTLITYIVGSLTLFGYSAMIICLVISINGLICYHEKY